MGAEKNRGHEVMVSLWNEASMHMDGEREGIGNKIKKRHTT